LDLSEKYTRTAGKAYLTGIQALVRLPLDQMRLDRRAGLNTGVLISGYEGSPLGGYDLALNKESKLLAEHEVHHWPAVNEDLGATAIYGAQILHTMGPARVDGVAGIWYGKGPGVDRSGDIFRHANLAGTSRLGCALVLAGDDHASKSSTIPHQSDFSLMNWAMPVLVPGSPQEILDLGLAGLALSRYSGAWVGLKLVTNVCDGGATLDLNLDRHQFRIPDDYQKKSETKMLAPWTIAAESEAVGPRLEAAKRFAAANKLNRMEGATNATIGIATAGKPYYDLLQALADAGLAGQLEAAGIRIAKFGMTFPLETVFAREFAQGLDTILVIEEKRPFLEAHLRDALYDLPVRPKIIGKLDHEGAALVPNYGELDPDMIATVLERVLTQAGLAERVRALQQPAASKTLPPVRLPNFCSGCPHNRSTMLLPGQVAGGGTGCHGMGILLPDSGRSYEYSTQMGGEGVPWVGMSPFSHREHIFQNLGDGTYFHSGSLAVQACVAAKVNITFKLLYNGHVAMTGGQAPSGVLAVPELTRKLAAEGVQKIVVLVEDVKIYDEARDRFAPNVELRDRGELNRTLAELPKIAGVTVMIYDQECAAEKRRSRSRGKTQEPTRRLVIHEEVCEGCGDCVTQSNCMSLQPVETELGQKMSIHQSSCNKDYTCALGDCPSFVMVEIAAGSGLPERKLPALEVLPEPKEMVAIGPGGYRILSPGIGGTGVITIHALLATAASIDGLEVSTLDQTGLAQKGGAVVSHLTLSRSAWPGAARINTGNADLILGFDGLGVVAPENLKCSDPARTVAVMNTHVTPTSESIRKRLPMPGPQENVDLIAARTRRERNVYVDATGIAEKLFSSHLSVNMFLLGAAWQAGLLPLSFQALAKAIELNRVEAQRNVEALNWGRLYYLDAARVEAVAKPAKVIAPVDRFTKLTQFQSRRYAAEWQQFVEAQPEGMRDVVGRYLYKLMAYKDEYEVARLLTGPALGAEIDGTFAAPRSYGYVLHPPILRALGWQKKIELGAWARPFMMLLGGLRFLRGTPLDLFGYAQHRREERELIVWYRRWVRECAEQWRPENQAAIREMLSLIDQVRGYGDIKSASVARVKKQFEEHYERMTGRRQATAK